MKMIIYLTIEKATGWFKKCFVIFQIFHVMFHVSFHVIWAILINFNTQIHISVLRPLKEAMFKAKAQVDSFPFLSQFH